MGDCSANRNMLSKNKGRTQETRYGQQNQARAMRKMLRRALSKNNRHAPRTHLLHTRCRYQEVRHPAHMLTDQHHPVHTIHKPYLYHFQERKSQDATLYQYDTNCKIHWTAWKGKNEVPRWSLPTYTTSSEHASITQ
jgi:hypothetical protein